MEVDDEPLLTLREGPPLYIRPKIVSPAEPAALAATIEPSSLGQVPPVPRPVLLYVIHEQLVLLSRPRPLLHVGISLTTR